MATYKDIDFNLLHSPEENDDAKTRVDTSDITQSIKNILLTVPGEKPFNPSFGVGMNEYLFQPLSTLTKQIIKNRILAQLEIYEPRAIVSNIDITEPAVGELTVEVTYVPEYNLNLERTATITV